MKTFSRRWLQGLAATVLVGVLSLAACGRRNVEPTLPALATFTPTPAFTPTPLPTATPAPGSFEVILTEAELNQSITRAVQDASALVSDIAVDLQPGLMVISGKAVLGFFPVNLRIAATAVVQEGKVQAQIQEVQVNGRVVGGVLRQQIDTLLAPYLSHLSNLGDDVTVETLEIGEDQIRIVGRK